MIKNIKYHITSTLKHSYNTIIWTGSRSYALSICATFISSQSNHYSNQRGGIKIPRRLVSLIYCPSVCPSFIFILWIYLFYEYMKMSWLILYSRHRENRRSRKVRKVIYRWIEVGKDRGGFFTGLRTKPTVSEHWRGKFYSRMKVKMHLRQIDRLKS